MVLPASSVWLLIIIIMFGTMITRFLPFLVFPEKKEPPQFVLFVSKCLPPAMMGLLVIYCLRNISFFNAPYSISEAVSVAAIIILHKWKNNVLLSIIGGTVIYMVLLHIL